MRIIKIKNCPDSYVCINCNINIYLYRHYQQDNNRSRKLSRRVYLILDVYLIGMTYLAVKVSTQQKEKKKKKIFPRCRRRRRAFTKRRRKDACKGTRFEKFLR